MSAEARQSKPPLVSEESARKPRVNAEPTAEKINYSKYVSGHGNGNPIRAVLGLAKPSVCPL